MMEENRERREGHIKKIDPAEDAIHKNIVGEIISINLGNACTPGIFNLTSTC